MILLSVLCCSCFGIFRYPVMVVVAVDGFSLIFVTIICSYNIIMNKD